MNEEKYIIDFCNGIKFDFFGTLDEARKEADDKVAYTQEDVKIRNANGVTITLRKWWGTAYDNTIDDAELSYIIDFGNFGYYSNWIEI